MTSKKSSSSAKSPNNKITIAILAILILIGSIIWINSFQSKLLESGILREIVVDVESNGNNTYSVKLKSADRSDNVYTQEAVATYTFENQIAAETLAGILKSASYTFESDTHTTNPAFTRADCAALLVKSTNLPIDTSDSPHFLDVNNTDWFFPYVETLANEGILETGGNFQPFAAVEKEILLDWIEKTQTQATSATTTIPRSQLAALLVEQANLPIDTSNSPHFFDVTNINWFFPYVETLANKGILGSNNIFRPDDPVNRAEVAALLVKTFGYTSTNNPPPYFQDVKPENWYYDYVQILAEKGILDTSEENFSPSANTKSEDLFEWIRKAE